MLADVSVCQSVFPENNTHRLIHRAEFLRFFEGAEVFKLGSCTIFCIPNTVGHYRLGITLKAKGTSVERNRVKRTIRASFNSLQALLGSKDYNVLITAYKKMDRHYTKGLRIDLVEKWPSRHLKK